MARAASTERSLLSQQIRVNSGSSLHSLQNSTHQAEAQLNTHNTDRQLPQQTEESLPFGKSHDADKSLPFPASSSPEASVPHHSTPLLLNGGPPVGLQDFMNGGTRHSSVQSQHHMQRVPDSSWKPDVDAHQHPIPVSAGLHIETLFTCLLGGLGQECYLYTTSEFSNAVEMGSTWC